MDLPGLEPHKPFDINWLKIESLYHNDASCQIQNHFHFC